MRMLITLVGIAFGGVACSSGTQTNTSGAADRHTNATAPTGQKDGDTSEAPAASSRKRSCTPGMPKGFERAARFAVPAARCGARFDTPATYGSLDYALVDGVGDATPDIVVVQDACDETVGATHWDVYEATQAGFAAQPSAWTLPSARCNTKFDAFSRSTTVAHALIDMTGDGRPELVVTRDACDESVGRTHWDVYKAGSDGFSETPKAFRVPARRCNTSFDAMAGYAPLAFSLLDITGDRVPDLVVTKDRCDSDIGKTRWDVYAGGPDGFSEATEAFRLPASRCEIAFDALAQSSSVAYFLSDFDGNRTPDLVVTRDRCDSATGQSHWDVYANRSGGFDLTPKAFSLPAGRCGTKWDAPAGLADVRFAMQDVTCDDLADLVVTRDACEKSVGTDRWDVYAASATGFARAPSGISLPTKRCQSEFDAFSNASDVLFSMFAAGTDRPSLVVTRDACDSDVGKTHWDRYPLR